MSACLATPTYGENALFRGGVPNTKIFRSVSGCRNHDYVRPYSSPNGLLKTNARPND